MKIIRLIIKLNYRLHCNCAGLNGGNVYDIQHDIDPLWKHFYDDGDKDLVSILDHVSFNLMNDIDPNGSEKARREFKAIVAVAKHSQKEVA